MAFVLASNLVPESDLFQSSASEEEAAAVADGDVAAGDVGDGGDGGGDVVGDGKDGEGLVDEEDVGDAAAADLRKMGLGLKTQARFAYPLPSSSSFGGPP